MFDCCDPHVRADKTQLLEQTYLSKHGLILSRFSDRLEAQGVELAELPRDDPGPGPRPISELVP